MVLQVSAAQSPLSSARSEPTRARISVPPIQLNSDATFVSQQVPMQAKVGKDSVKIDMEFKFPKHKEKPKKVTVPRPVGTELSAIFTERRFPEAEYFQNIDCTGMPEFFTPQQCRKIIDYAERGGFSRQQPHKMMNLQWYDITDTWFAGAIWELCGLSWFLRSIKVDGLVPCGVNDVLRIHKYSKDCFFGRHTDQCVQRADGKISKLSLRVFLNGAVEDFAGGMSAFHVPFRREPVVFEPEGGLALLYPQGEMCTVQEEAMVQSGHKYVLRADILFGRPEEVERAAPLTF